MSRWGNFWLSQGNQNKTVGLESGEWWENDIDGIIKRSRKDPPQRELYLQSKDYWLYYKGNIKRIKSSSGQMKRSALHFNNFISNVSWGNNWETRIQVQIYLALVLFITTHCLLHLLLYLLFKENLWSGISRNYYSFFFTHKRNWWRWPKLPVTKRKSLVGHVQHSEYS